MQSHYEINVSLNGRHFFATAPRSCVSEFEAKRVHTEIVARFPASEGFEVSCTYWQASGQRISFL